MRKLTYIFLILLSSNFVFGQFGYPTYVVNNLAGSLTSKTADIDNDGDLDIISSSFNNDRIIWYENLGLGNFSNYKIISSEIFQCNSIVVIDIDNDGKNDVVACSKTDGIVWCKNLGNGLFGQKQIITNNLIEPWAIHAVDIDNDGDLDVVSGDRSADKIAWNENLGTGNFDTLKIISTNVDRVHFVFAADMDNDGFMDVLSASYIDDKVAWYKNLGNGVIDTAQRIISTNANGVNSIFSEDLDNDGDYDVIAALGISDNLVWFENLGGGVIDTTQRLISSNTDGATSVVSSDLDNDGDFDVVACSTVDGKISWYENLTSGNIDTNQNLLIGDIKDPRSVSSEDLDNDGDMDILASSYQSNKIIWFENLGTNNFSNAKLISRNSVADPISKAYDLDGDGDQDILTLNRDNSGSIRKFVWQENLGAAVFGQQQLISDSIIGNRVDFFVEDLDNDSDLDVLITANNNSILWYENNGSGNFINTHSSIIFGSPITFRMTGLADIDNDGDLDAIIESMYVSKNLGNGNFDMAVNVGNVFHQSTIACDVDNDSLIDLIGSGQFAGNISWYKNLGNGTFGAPNVYSNSYYTRAYISDINADGHDDFLATFNLSDRISIGVNTMPGDFQNIQNLNNLDAAYFVNAADLDSDNDKDLIAVFRSNTYPYQSIAWFENDNNLFNPNYHEVSNLASQNDVFPIDVDKDGDIDILTNEYNNVLWYENFTTSPYKLKGKFYYDANQNGSLDSTESGLSLFKATLQPVSWSSYTDNDGNYIISPDTGRYKVTYVPNPLWNLTTDSLFYNPTLTSSSTIIDSLNFGFYPDTIITIIQPDITAGFPRCNSHVNYNITIKNIGTSIIDGIIHLTLDSAVSYVSSEIIPDSIVGQEIYWHYDSLFFYNIDTFNLIVAMPPFTSIGESLISSLFVYELDSNDSITYSVSDSLIHSLFCAYDPNDKNVTPKGLGENGFILNNQELEYLIRFQNTGNDTAITVMIRDQLDSSLDWNSMQIISSSHLMQVWIEQDGEAVFKFENIMLPDSGVDLLGSQGFVKFKINMDTNLVPGTQIKNEGHIYFDYNPAVITNNVINTIYDCDEVTVSLTDTLICYGETMLGFSADGVFSDLLWEIDTFYTSLDDTLNWTADTVGVFDLKLTVSNELCSKDTTYSITILPELPIVNVNQSICDGDSMLIYGNYQNIAGVYYDSLQTIQGCDSILSTTLIVDSVYLSNQNQSICQGDSILLYGIYQNTSGVYYDSLQTIDGCDSVLSTTLMIDSIYYTTTNQSICQGDSILIYGNYEFLAGTYYDSLQTTNGCDSVLSTTLTIDSLPNVFLSSFSPDTLCDNGSLVSLPIGTPSGGNYSGNGISGGNFNPTSVGIGTHQIVYTYIDSNSCVNSDTTIVTVKVCVGIDEQVNDFGILIYPNPNMGLFTIEKPAGLNEKVEVKLLDATSKLIIDKVIPVGKQKIEVDITNYSKGVYYLQLIVGEEVFVKQILKN